MALAQAAPEVKAVGPLKPAPKILVLSGGGVLGIAEMGVIDALKHHNLTDEIEIVAGTSIGSLVGFGLALNSPEKHYIKKLLSGEVDLREFPDKFPAEYEVKPKDPSYVKCAKYLYNGGLSLFNSLKVKATDPHLVTYGKAMLMPIQTTGSTLLKLANTAKTAYQNKGVFQGKYIEDTVKKITSEMITTHKSCLEIKLQAVLKDDSFKEKILADRKLSAPTSEMKDIDAALIKLQDIVAGKATLTFGALHLIRLLAPELHLKDLVVTATNVRTKPLRDTKSLNKLLF